MPDDMLLVTGAGVMPDVLLHHHEPCRKVERLLADDGMMVLQRLTDHVDRVEIVGPGWGADEMRGWMTAAVIARWRDPHAPFRFESRNVRQIVTACDGAWRVQRSPYGSVAWEIVPA